MRYKRYHSKQSTAHCIRYQCSAYILKKQCRVCQFFSDNLVKGKMKNKSESAGEIRVLCNSNFEVK